MQEPWDSVEFAHVPEELRPDLRFLSNHQTPDDHAREFLTSRDLHCPSDGF